ncbi:hypothetical protein [Mycolicibacterium komossense]|uniref:Cache domain-containing protein n=1 Tax=Mycolicibacterium komossense TaxID=1779 RepID=A0ABT3CC09_9MYCO|nr:hypothetical protein [Mycolicibacterium komossense]MCV7226971.1 hypothetical protein [Mycolicibacterium komossense]
MTGRGKDVSQEIEELAIEVASRIDSVVNKLNVLAGNVSSARQDFEYLASATRQMLEDGGSAGALAGAGYAVSYLDSGRPPAMVWWVHRGDTTVERSHSVDPDSESFYDYAALRWFRTARDSGLPTLSGPFIDAWGADDYTVTVSLPVPGPSGPQGVVAADVDVRRFTESLTADLRRISVPLALVNESDRVVVSTVPVLSTGLPIQSRADQSRTQSPVLQRFPVSTYGWSVVSLAV